MLNHPIDQLWLFPELALTYLEPSHKRSPSRSTSAPSRAPQLDRRLAIERLGGWWGLRLHTGHKIVAPGTILYAPTGRCVGVYRILNAIGRWGTADLYCFALRALELEFGFLSLGFLEDPERYVRDRTLELWQPKELWEYEPPEEIQKPLRKSVKQPPAKMEEMTSRQLEHLIWEWLRKEFPSRQRREQLKICLREQDKLPLNNLLSFCQQEVKEAAQKLRKSFDQDDFDRLFWTLLECLHDEPN